MSDIDLGKMTDRELLVVTATTVNGLNGKLDTFCLRVESLEEKFTGLKTEHDMRVLGGENCSYIPGRSRRELAATGSIGGLIVGALILLVEYLIKALQ